jgi:hypothetical protein
MDDSPLSNDIRSAIANVVANSAQLDRHLDTAVAHLLLGKEATARFLLKSLGYDQVLGLYEALLLDEFPESERQIADMISLIEELRKEREELLDWLWKKTEAEGVGNDVSIRPQAKYQTAESISIIAAGMRRAVSFMTGWMERADMKHRDSLRRHSN